MSDPLLLTLTEEERQLALDRLNHTKQQFFSLFEPLSATQWAYKADPGQWSAAEIAEHIAISEVQLSGLLLHKVLQSPPNPDKAAEIRGKEGFLLKAVPDRRMKVQAPDFIRPTGRWIEREPLFAEFGKSRDALIQYISTTEAPVRGHIHAHPFFEDLDFYQWVLFVSVHNERHFLQFEELKSHPEFPAA
ncbi:MAG: DinB family protein [Blastocatellia bacterium]|nr:DinB family protein [Blastocatellia bacterium]